MNRVILAAGCVAIAFFFVFISGCEDNSCSLQCPPDDSDFLQPIDVLVTSALAFPSMSRIIPGPLLDCGFLPAGSTVDTFSLLDYSRELVVPPLELLEQYDALLVFTDAWPASDPGPGAFDTIGNLLADYVDGGGGVVICQFAINGLAAGIRGRIVSPGYSPLRDGYLETGLDPDEDRMLSMDSIDYPLHPVFYGIAIDSLNLPGDYALGRPELDDTAVLLAIDDHGANSVAVNSGGTIIGINMYFKPFAFPDEYPETIKLVAGSLVFVSRAGGE